MRGEHVRLPLHPVHRATGENGDAGLLHLAANVRAHVLIETAQHIVAAIDQRHVGAETGEDAGEFQRDVAAALNDDAPGLLFQMEHLVGGDHMLDAGDRRSMIGRAAGRDQNTIRANGLAGGEPQRVRVLEHRTRLDDARARLLDIGGVDVLKPGDLLVLVGNEVRPVKRRGRNGPAETGRVLDLLMDMRGIDEQLLGHAAANDAGAAEAVFLGDGDAGSVTGRDPRGAHPARAAADHEQIDIRVSHSLAPALRHPLRADDQMFLPRARISARNLPLISSLSFCAQLAMYCEAPANTTGS